MLYYTLYNVHMTQVQVAPWRGQLSVPSVESGSWPGSRENSNVSTSYRWPEQELQEAAPASRQVTRAMQTGFRIKLSKYF